MFHGRPGGGDFGGSYDCSMFGDPRGSGGGGGVAGGHGVEFGGARGEGPRTGSQRPGFAPDQLLEDQRRYYSSDSVPMHSESYHMQQQQSLPPPPPHRGVTMGDLYDGGPGGYGGGGAAAAGRRLPRGHEFGGESDMESVVSVTSAFSSHSAPHARGRRMMHPASMQQG